MSQEDQKRADLARQEAANEAGNRRFAQTEANIYSKMGEDFQRQFFNMTRTERQMYGLKMINTGNGSAACDKWKVKKKVDAWSKCCKAPAYCYRSVSFGLNNPKNEKYWRCRGCGGDCQIQKTKPRRKKRSS